MFSEQQAEYFLDRRNLRRKVTFWRFVAFGVVTLSILAVGMKFGGPTSTLSPHIARFDVNGLITGDRDTLQLIKDIGESKAAAVIVDISSPGGTVTGSERIYDELRRLSAKKPVVAVVGSLAASGAYIAALGADRIFAGNNSLVGSIGVLFEFPNVAKLLDNVGVKVETIKSSPLKAAPNGFEPTSDAARAAINNLVVDSYAWFKALVKERRQLTDAELNAVADGRVFTGHQGMPLKLIDAIGQERDAVAWLESERGVAKGLSVKEWKKKGAVNNLGLFSLASGFASAMGFERIAQALQTAGHSSHDAALDGLLAIWQVDATN